MGPIKFIKGKIKLEMKDLRKLKHFLKIEVAYSKQDTFICQRKYVFDLLQETGKLECKLASAPIEQNHKKSFDEEGAKFIANLALIRKVGLICCKPEITEVRN